MATSSDALTLCLVSDAEPVRAAVRVSCPPPHTVETFSLDEVLDADHTVSGYGASVVRAARSADAVLVDWSMAHAALINMLCHAIRRADSFVPVIALCSGGKEETIAALAAGADDVAGFPLHVPLLQARIAAYHRLVRVVQRATSTRLKKKLTRSRKKAARSAEINREERADRREAAVEMHFLRKKLAARGLGSVLQTVRGRGYRLIAPDAQTT